MMPPPGSKKKMPMPDMAPKGMRPPGSKEMPPEEKPEEEGGKHTAEEAHPVRADQHCKDCANYQAESGDCSKVDGYWDPEDACVRFFEAGSGDDEDAEDPAEEAGESPEEEAAEVDQ